MTTPNPTPAKKENTKLEQRTVKLAKQIAYEASGYLPIGRNYRRLSSWPAWYQQAKRELLLKCYYKHPEKFDRLMEKLL